MLRDSDCCDSYESFKQLLDGCTAFSGDYRDSLKQLAKLLAEGAVAPVFLELLQREDVELDFVTDLVKLPDRTMHLVCASPSLTGSAVDHKLSAAGHKLSAAGHKLSAAGHKLSPGDHDYPAVLTPTNYCSALLRNLCLALHNSCSTNSSSTSTNSNTIANSDSNSNNSGTSDNSSSANISDCAITNSDSTITSKNKDSSSTGDKDSTSIGDKDSTSTGDKDGTSTSTISSSGGSPPTLSPRFPRMLLERLMLNYREAVTSSLRSSCCWRFLASLASTSQDRQQLCSDIFTGMAANPLERYFLAALAASTTAAAAASTTAAPASTTAPASTAVAASTTAAGDSNSQPGLSIADLCRLFGPAFLAPPRFKIIENNLFVRGLRGGAYAVKTVVTWLHQTQPDRIPRLFLQALRLFVDPVVVESATHSDHLSLCSVLCCCLSVLTVRQLKEVKRGSALAILMRGSGLWLDTAPHNRDLGMMMILILLRGLGESQLPDWEVRDTLFYSSLKALAQHVPRGEDVPREKHVPCEELLSRWEKCEDIPTVKPKVTETVKQTRECERTAASKATEQLAAASKVTEPLDSDDDDDDDFPAHDMRHDEVRREGEGEGRLVYLREVVEALANPENTDPEYCLQVLPELCAKHLRFEDSSLVAEILQAVLYAENKFDTSQWLSLRESAVLSVIECRPLESAKCLVPAFYDKNHPVNTRFAILDWITKGGRRLAVDGDTPSPVDGDTPSPVTSSLRRLQLGGDLEAAGHGKSSASEMAAGSRPGSRHNLADYLRLTVTGLCSASGWHQLDVSGSDSQLISHLLLSVGELVRLGCNYPGWEGLASNYLYLALYLVSSKAIVEAAVLHSIRLVAVLCPPHLLVSSDNLNSFLTRAAVWAGRREGELAEEGQQVVLLLAMLAQEGRQQELASSIKQANTPSNNIKYRGGAGFTPTHT